MVVALLLLGGAACSDEGDATSAGTGAGGLSAAEQAYVDEALEGFDAEREAPMTEADARCIATSMVEGVGVERLEEMGITPESFSDDGDLPDGAVEEADAEAMVDGISECIDIRGLFLAGFNEDGSLSAEAEECLADAFDEDLVKRTMVVLLTEGEDALSDDSGVGAEVMQTFLACPGALE
jgi:hypothetical protein